MKDARGFRLGRFFRGGAGIGTVTFILPDTGAFAGLGHGICDGDAGELISMRRGQVTDVTVSGIERGEAGAAGGGCHHPLHPGRRQGGAVPREDLLHRPHPPRAPNASP